MRKIGIGIGTVVALLIAIYFLFLRGELIELRFSREDIKERIEKKLPFQKDGPHFYTLIKNVRIDFPEQSTRIRVGFDLEISGKKLLKGILLNGSIDLDSSIRYEESSAQFFLDDAQLLELKMDKISSTFSKKIIKGINKSVIEYVYTIPIYRLKESDVKNQLTRAFLKKIRIDQGQLIVVIKI